MSLEIYQNNTLVCDNNVVLLLPFNSKYTLIIVSPYNSFGDVNVVKKLSQEIIHQKKCKALNKTVITSCT